MPLRIAQGPRGRPRTLLEKSLTGGLPCRVARRAPYEARLYPQEYRLNTAHAHPHYTLEFPQLPLPAGRGGHLARGHHGDGEAL